MTTHNMATRRAPRLRAVLDAPRQPLDYERVETASEPVGAFWPRACRVIAGASVAVLVVLALSVVLPL